MISVRKVRSVLVCLFLLLSMAPPFLYSAAPPSSLQAAFTPRTISGGPIIDASLYGNRELYPGQTACIQVVIQNSGVLESLVGYETPKPDTYAVTLSTSASSESSSTESGLLNGTAGDTGACDNGTQDGGDAAAAASQALTSVQSESGTSSVTDQVSTRYDDYEMNTAAGLDIAVTTALGVTAKLSTGGAPIEIVSADCVDGGSLPAGSVSPPFSFTVRVDRGAKQGVYALPVTVTYKRLSGEYDIKSAFGNIASYNNYVQESVTLYVYVVIREAFDLVVSVECCQDMVPGADGTVTLTVTNVGGVCADESVVYLSPSFPGPSQDGSSGSSFSVGSSLVLPIQSSQFLGRMDPGDVRPVSFKVAVSPDAEAGTYPLSAMVSYTDAWGQQKSSNVDTFGVAVQPEMKFSVDDMPIVIKDGQTANAKLNLTNIGPDTARDAVVRMNALDPFVVSYDTAYLGDVSPGEEVNTTFGIKVKSDAVPTTYYVTLEVKYYDSDDDPHVTKIIQKAITVAPPPTIVDTALANWPLLAGLGAVATIGLLYGGRSFLRDKKKPPPEPPQQVAPVAGESNGQTIKEDGHS